MHENVANSHERTVNIMLPEHFLQEKQIDLLHVYLLQEHFRACLHSKTDKT